LSDEAGKLATGQEVQPVLVTSRPRCGRREPRDLTDGELAGRVYQRARCAGSPVDPDDWFPVTYDVAKARDQAAQAIAVCARCPVRPDCLELSLRHACGIRRSRGMGRLGRGGTTVAPPQVAGRDQRH
jgi:hypothetical protein